MLKHFWKVIQKLLSKIESKFSDFSIQEFAFRMSSRKLWLILLFTWLAYYLNTKDRLSPAMADVLVGMALAYCGSNILSKKLNKE